MDGLIKLVNYATVRPCAHKQFALTSNLSGRQQYYYYYCYLFISIFATVSTECPHSEKCRFHIVHAITYSSKQISLKLCIQLLYAAYAACMCLSNQCMFDVTSGSKHLPTCQLSGCTLMICKQMYLLITSTDAYSFQQHCQSWCAFNL